MSDPHEKFLIHLTNRLCTRQSATAVLIAVWAICYLPHLRSSPGWYGDETITLLAGKSILKGDFANRALTYSFFSPFTNYQPPAITLYALFSGLTAGDIIGGRFLSVTIGLVTSLVVYWLTVERLGNFAALSAALTVLMAPQHTIHFRWIYPHYFCTLAVIIIGLLYAYPATRKRDWFMGCSCALAASGHLLAVYIIFAAMVTCVKRPSAWIRIIAPPAIVLSLSLALGYYASGPQLTLDLRELAGTYASSSERTDIPGKLANVIRFFSWDVFHLLLLLSFAGLAAMRRFAELAFVGIISLAIIQNRAELPVFYYQSMVFVPLLTVYASECLFRGATALARLAKSTERIQTLVAGAAIAVLPACFMPSAIGNSLAGTHVSRNAYWVAPSASDLESAAAWIDANTNPDELVISYWDAGWLLRGRWTDLMQCAVWEDGSFPFFYDRQRSHKEFRFPADMRSAKFILVGQLDLRWLWGQGDMPKLLAKHHVPSWPIVHQTQTTFVLRNPSFKANTDSGGDK